MQRAADSLGAPGQMGVSREAGIRIFLNEERLNTKWSHLVAWREKVSVVLGAA